MTLPSCEAFLPPTFPSTHRNTHPPHALSVLVIRPQGVFHTDRLSYMSVFSTSLKMLLIFLSSWKKKALIIFLTCLRASLGNLGTAYSSHTGASSSNVCHNHVPRVSLFIQYVFLTGPKALWCPWRLALSASFCIPETKDGMRDLPPPRSP